MVFVCVSVSICCSLSVSIRLHFFFAAFDSSFLHSLIHSLAQWYRATLRKSVGIYLSSCRFLHVHHLLSHTQTHSVHIAYECIVGRLFLPLSHKPNATIVHYCVCVKRTLLHLVAYPSQVMVCRQLAPRINQNSTHTSCSVNWQNMLWDCQYFSLSHSRSLSVHMLAMDVAVAVRISHKYLCGHCVTL